MGVDKEKLWMVGWILYLLSLNAVFVATCLLSEAFVGSRCALVLAIAVTLLIGFWLIRLGGVASRIAIWSIGQFQRLWRTE
jgi:hypothetical protein